jgi:hypothetical protein
MTSPHMHQHNRGVHLEPTHDSSQNHAIPKLIGYLVSLSNQKAMSLFDDAQAELFIITEGFAHIEAEINCWSQFGIYVALRLRRVVLKPFSNLFNDIHLTEEYTFI